MRFDEDFGSGFEDSKFDKLKPFIKAACVTLLVVIASVAAFVYFDQSPGNEDKQSTSTPSVVESDDMGSLSDCLAEVANTQTTPDVNDSDFYPKLIAVYDSQIACYDAYPDDTGSVGRISVESARQSALDSSGDYKSSYAAGGSSWTDSKTGCSYKLSESEFIKCTDKYNKANGTSYVSSYTPPSTSSAPSSSSSSQNSGSNTIGGSSSSTSSSSAADKAYWQSKCEQQVQQQAGGTSLTQSQRDAMEQQCMISHGY